MSMYKQNLMKSMTLTKLTAKGASAIAESNFEDDMFPSGNLSVDIYKENARKRNIIINDVIDERMIEKVVMQLEKFNAEDDEKEEVGFDRRATPITIFINSPGGYISHGLAIVSAIEQSRTPVITVGQGACASMAAVILAVGHARFAYRHCRIMIHSLAGGHEGKLYDKIDDVEECQKLQKVLDSILVERTKITQKKLDEVHLQRKDWYLSSEEAKELGIVDEVCTVGINMTPPKKRKKPVKSSCSCA